MKKLIFSLLLLMTSVSYSLSNQELNNLAINEIDLFVETFDVSHFPNYTDQQLSETSEMLASTYLENNEAILNKTYYDVSKSKLDTKQWLLLLQTFKSKNFLKLINKITDNNSTKISLVSDLFQNFERCFANRSNNNNVDCSKPRYWNIIDSRFFDKNFNYQIIYQDFLRIHNMMILLNAKKPCQLLDQGLSETSIHEYIYQTELFERKYHYYSSNFQIDHRTIIDQYSQCSESAQADYDFYRAKRIAQDYPHDCKVQFNVNNNSKQYSITCPNGIP